MGGGATMSAVRTRAEPRAPLAIGRAVDEIRSSLEMLSGLEGLDALEAAEEQSTEADAVERVGRALSQMLESQRRVEVVAATAAEAQRRLADARSAWQSDVAAFQRLVAELSASRTETERVATRATSAPRTGERGRAPSVDAPTPRRRAAVLETRRSAAIEVRSGSLPALSIACFGRFEVRRGGDALKLCPNRSGQTILRYLATHPRRRETMESLMDLLWPGDSPKVARHKLHCAFSALRGSLNAGLPDPGPGYVRYIEGSYELAREAPISTDLDAFLSAFHAGQRAGGSAAVPFFESACRMYVGQLLPDDGYADWALERRDVVVAAYVSMCHAVARQHAAAQHWDEATEWYGRMLVENRCDETAHRGLMRVHVAAGRRGDALRQYQQCLRALADDLGVGPMQETTALFEAIRSGDAVAGRPVLGPPVPGTSDS